MLAGEFEAQPDVFQRRGKREERRRRCLGAQERLALVGDVGRRDGARTRGRRRRPRRPDRQRSRRRGPRRRPGSTPPAEVHRELRGRSGADRARVELRRVIAPSIGATRVNTSGDQRPWPRSSPTPALRALLGDRALMSASSIAHGQRLVSEGARTAPGPTGARHRRAPWSRPAAAGLGRASRKGGLPVAVPTRAACSVTHRRRPDRVTSSVISSPASRSSTGTSPAGNCGVVPEEPSMAGLGQMASHRTSHPTQTGKTDQHDVTS